MPKIRDGGFSLPCECGGQTEVVDSRGTARFDGVRRRRRCLECHARFTTYESRDRSGDAIEVADRMQRQLAALVTSMRSEIAALRGVPTSLVAKSKGCVDPEVETMT